MRELEAPLTLLQLLIRRRDTSYEAVTRELEEFARQRGIDGTVSARHLQRLARRERTGTSGQAAALPGTRRLLSDFFGHPFDELVGPPPAEVPLTPAGVSLPESVSADLRGLTSAAAQGSLDFLAWAEDDLVPGALLDHVTSELRRIAVDYVYRPIAPLFRDLLDLRDTTFRLLRDRPHPRQARELFFTAGTVCTLLAHASQNMGNSAAARTQAATAWTCAEQADHRDLRAWVRGTQALIAEWSDRYNEAITYAREGQQYAGSVESRVRLAAIEGRALAKNGDAAAAVEAVDRAARARDESQQRPDALAQFGGVLDFPAVKQVYYAGSTLMLAGRSADAERNALEAIRIYESGRPEDRSYGDEALARVDVAMARTLDDDVEGASEALRPVLELPPAQRIEQLGTGLGRVRSRLILPRYTRSREAQELNAAIDGFLTPPGHQLPPGTPS